MNWILASASPRRKEILQHLGVQITVITSDADENITPCGAEDMVRELSRRKALAVYQTLPKPLSPDTLIIGSDTVVESPDGEIFGKPRDREDAVRMLRSLSGREHRVVSGVCVCDAQGNAYTAAESTGVIFSRMSEQTIARYAASGECDDKAGAYGVQDTAALWIEGLRGDYFNVVGLPVHRLETLLQDTLGVSLLDE
jgi:septum formation protein